MNGDKDMDGLTTWVEGSCTAEAPRVPPPGNDVALEVPGSHEGERGDSLE